MKSTTGAEVTALSMAALTSVESSLNCCGVVRAEGTALRVMALKIGVGAR
jgi:hypothetical protein